MRVPHIFADENGAIKRNYLDDNFAALSAGAFTTPQSFGAVGDGVADDTAEIQAALNSSSAVYISGTFRVTSAITVNNRQFLFGPGVIFQATPNTEIFNFAGKSNIFVFGLTLQGLGTDFINSDSSRAVAFFGGTSGSNNRFESCTFDNFTYTSVKFQNQTDCFFIGNTVTGPGAPTLTPVSSGANYGVLFDAGCFNVVCSGNKISECAQGVRIEVSKEVAITGNVIFDIVGQHGIYAGAGLRNVTVSGNTIRNVDLIGIKFQSEDASGLDNTNISVVGNTVQDTGDQGILIGSGDNPGSIQKHRNVTVTGNSVHTAGSNGITSDNTHGLVVSSNVIQGCVQSGVYITEVDNFLIDANAVTSCALSGMREGLACTNGVISNNKLQNVATAGTVGDRFGMLFQTGTDMLIKGNVVRGSAGTMQYGFFLNGGPTYSTVDNESLVATDCGVRFQLTTTQRAYFGNRWGGTLAASFNEPAVPTVASAAALTLPQQQAVISISGTTNITSIVATGHAGRIVQLVFQGALTFTDGANLNIAGNFVTTANDSIALGCDGVSWNEIGRSVN